MIFRHSVETTRHVKLSRSKTKEGRLQNYVGSWSCTETLTALGCLFLAGKVEETPKKCRDICNFAAQKFPSLYVGKYRSFIWSIHISIYCSYCSIAYIFGSNLTLEDATNWWDEYVSNLSTSLIDDICHKVLDFYSISKDETMDFMPPKEIQDSAY
uniref:Rab-GAP TBC domain-containing protein n=1 Tax=Heterorhabditis bacteriophora TaxID=37862 RepID=A0A1I7WCN1_HETBA